MSFVKNGGIVPEVRD